MTSRTAHPPLIPTPRSLKMLGGSRVFPSRLGVHAVDPTLTSWAAEVLCGIAREGKQADVLLRLDERQSGRPGAYTLRIEQTGSVRVLARQPEGLRAGVHTLAQLQRWALAHAQPIGELRLPLLIIEDHAAFAHRGVMLDISRDRVPTMAHLFATVRTLAELKFNHLQLYTEHTFAYAGHEDAWLGWSPMTPDEYRRLDVWCLDHGITLAANQNCFGHLASWLKLPRYQHLAEIQGLDTAWQFYAWERKGPFSLCPTDPAAVEFVAGLLDQLLPCFSSGLCNINADETADVGQGRSRDACAAHGRAAVYFDFLDRVVELVRAHGFRPMFWADIALSHPEATGRIAKDMTCLAWDYEPDARFGQWCRTLAGECGLRTWVCPGTSSWRSFTGRTRERRGNIDAAAREGLAGGAEGILTCDWGDVGHRQTWPVSLHGLANAAEASWIGDGSASEYRLDAESFHIFGDSTGAAARWLESLGDADEQLRSVGGTPGADGAKTRLRNATAIFNDYHTPWTNAWEVGDLAAWEAVIVRTDTLAGTLPPVGSLFREEMAHAAHCAQTAARRGLLRRTQTPPASAMRYLLDRMHQIQASHARLWRVRSREGGFENSSSHDRAAIAELAGLLNA